MNRREIDVLAFVSLAVREFAKEQILCGKPIPDDLREVMADLALRRESAHNGSSRGHNGSSVDRGSTGADDGVSSSQLLITYAEAARRLGCSVSTIKRRVADGHLTPVRREGHRPRLQLAEINAYVEESRW